MEQWATYLCDLFRPLEPTWARFQTYHFYQTVDCCCVHLTYDLVDMIIF